MLAGLWWPQHVTFLDTPRHGRNIERTLRTTVRQYADHPALLAVAIGNEIPVPIVRWHGAAAIERHLRRLYDAAKDADPGALVTYVNYPTTEYLELPFLEFGISSRNTGSKNIATAWTRHARQSKGKSARS